MSRQDANAAFALSSFLQGTNATYIDDIYARFEKNPSSVDAEWQDFFKSLKDTPSDVRKNAEGPSWGRDNWPLAPRDDLTSALDGNWAEVEKSVGTRIAAKAQARGAELTAADIHQATRDSVRALMLIRAYRMRGHFHAKLDPLGIEAPRDREELDPRSYGFTEADFDRKIFLDHVLGLEYGTLREIVAICERTYCQTLGVEFMHITNAAQKAWIQERIEGPDKEISFTREGRRAILNKLVEAEGFEKFCDTRSSSAAAISA
jgi:2-oxoglutarate dehydrogenase E1 component